MEQPHLASQLEYLEQKQQEALSMIAKLQQRLENQEFIIQEQTRRIQKLEQEVSQNRSQLAYITRHDSPSEQFKNEIMQMVENRARRIVTVQPVSSSGGNSNNNFLAQQVENQARDLVALRRDLEKTNSFTEQLNLARAESTRLNQELHKLQASLDAVNRQLDERTRPVTYLEEQRRAEAGKLASLQAELPTLHKKVESSLTKTALVAQQIPQFSKYEAALDMMRDEIRNYREHMDFQLAQRERQIKDWTSLAESTERRIREIEASMEKYAEFYQLNKRALTSLQEFQERVQRDQHRFGELQRLAEDRQRGEMEKFQTAIEQRWQKQSLERQPEFLDFQRSMESTQQRLTTLTKLHQEMEAQLTLVLQIVEEDFQTRVQQAISWQDRFEALAEGQS